MPRKLEARRKKSKGLQEAAIAFGSYAKMADKLRLTPGAVCRWTKVPERYLLKIEAMTGVKRQDLRPDLYN
jgi:DNA-binding transcriptional regulator YdaS (Cro superfamily)